MTEHSHMPVLRGLGFLFICFFSFRKGLEVFILKYGVVSMIARQDFYTGEARDERSGSRDTQTSPENRKGKAA